VSNRVLFDLLLEEVLHDDLVLPSKRGEHECCELPEVAELHPLTAAEVFLVHNHFVLEHVRLYVVKVPNLLDLEQLLKGILIRLSLLDLIFLFAEGVLQLLPGERLAFVTHVVVEHTDWLGIPALVSVLHLLLVHAEAGEVDP